MSATKQSRWWKNLFAPRPKTNPKPRRYTPRFITLEDRIVPDATLSIINGVVTYSDTQNLANTLTIKQVGTDYVFTNNAQKIDTDDAALSDADKTATFAVATITQINISFGGTSAKSITLGDFNAAVAGLSVTGNDRTGSNALVAAAGGGLSSAGGVALSGFKQLNVQNQITGATGNVTLAADQITAAFPVTATDGDITLTADTLAITADVTATNHRVTLQPKTDDRPVNLGTETLGSLSVENDELDRLFAGVVQIGSTTAGPITVSAALAPAGTTALDLRSNGALGGAGSLTVGTLAFDAASVNLTGSLGTASGSTDAGGVTLTDTAGGLTLAGVAATGGPVAITTTGALNVTQNITAGGAHDITLTTKNASSDADNITVGANVQITSATGDIFFVADNDITLDRTVSLSTGAPGKIFLRIDATGIDTDGATLHTGGTSNLLGATLNAPAGATFTGGDDDDAFFVSPSAATPITVNGGSAGTDVLTVFAVGLKVKHNPVTKTITTSTPPPAPSALKPIVYTNLDSVAIFSLPPVEIVGTAGNDILTVDLASRTARLQTGATTKFGSNAFSFDGLDGDDKVVLVGTAGIDSVLYRRNSSTGDAEFDLNGNNVFNTIHDVETFQFDGLGGDDLFTVDYVNGDPLPALGVLFNGGNNTDTLAVQAATGGAKTRTGRYLPDAATAGNGEVRVDDNVAKPIRFTGLAPVDVTGFTTFTVNFPNANDLVTVTGSFAFAAPLQKALRVSGTSGGVAFETLAVWDVTTLTIDTQTIDGADVVTLQATDLGTLHKVTNLNVLTGALADAVSVTGLVNLTGNLQITHAAAGLTTLNANVTTTGGSQSYQGAVVVGVANPVLTAGGTATFASTVIGPGGLTVNAAGNTTFVGAVSVGTPLASLATGNGGTTFFTAGGTVSTTGAQTYADAVQLNANTSFFSTGGGNISFNSTLDGTVTVTVNTVGTTTFGGSVGSVLPPPLSLTTNFGGTTVINGAAVKTSGDQTYNDDVDVGSGGSTLTSTAGNLTFDQTLDTFGPLTASAAGTIALNGAVRLSGNATFASTGGGAITFASTLDRRTPGDTPAVTVTTSGATTFTGIVGGVGGSTPLGSLTTNGGNTTFVNGGSVTTSGDQTYTDAVQVGANTVFASTGAGNISFNSTLNGGFSVGVNTGGTTAFGNTVGNAAALLALATDTGGSTQINTTLVRTVNAQSYGDPVQTGTAAATLTNTAVGQAITFGQTLDTFGVLLVQATGAVTATGAVKLTGDATFTSTGAAAVTFSSTLDRLTAGDSPDVTVNTTGATTFTGAVGTAGPLASLTTDLGGVTNINGGSVTTTGSQTYNDDVDVGAAASLTASAGNLAFNQTLDTFGALTASAAGTIALNEAVRLSGNATFSSTGGGAITFASTLDRRTPGDTPAVTVTTSGATTFTGIVGGVGGTTPLGFLTTNGGGTTFVNGGAVNTTAGQTFTDAVQMGTNTSFFSTGGGNISFNSTLDGAFVVNVNTVGTTTFGGSVGNAATLISLDTNFGGTTVINGAVVKTGGGQTYGDDVDVGSGGSALTAGGITFGQTLDTFGALSATAAGTIALNGAVRLSGNATFASTGGGAITFASTLDRRAAGDTPAVTVTTSGATTFTGAVGAAGLLGSLATNGGNTTFVNGGSVNTSGGQTFTDAVQVGTNTTFAGSSVNFVSTLDGSFAVTVNAAATTFGGPVGNGSVLTSLTTDASGTTAINGGLVRTTGSQTYGDDVDVAAVATTLSANGAAPNILFGKTLDTLSTLAVQATSATTAGAAVTFTGAVRLTGNATVTSTTTAAGGNVTFTSTLDRLGGAPAVTINTTGQTRFDGAVGGISAPQALTTNADGTTFIKGGLVKTVAAQTYFDDVRLDSAATRLETAGGNVLFATTLVGIPDCPALTINTGSGDLTFNGAVNDIGNLLIENARNVLVAATVTVSSFVQANGSGTTTFNAPTTVTHECLFADTYELDVSNQNITVNANLSAGTNDSRLRLLGGQLQQPGGVFSAKTLRFEGAGAFNLNRVSGITPVNAVGSFSANVNGRIALTVGGTLEINADLGGDIPAGVVTSNSDVTLETGRNFIANSPAATLFDLGTGVTGGVLRVTPGLVLVEKVVPDPKDPTKTIKVPVISTTLFDTEIKAREAHFGEEVPVGLFNQWDDEFNIRPSQTTPIFVWGNSPVVKPGDQLNIILTAVPSDDVVEIKIEGLFAKNDDSKQGTVSFLKKTRATLTFNNIEFILNKARVREAFTFQVAPNKFNLDFLGEIDGKALSGLTPATALQENVFVVSPRRVNPKAPFGAPRVTLADVNKDGVDDIILANGSNTAPVVSIIDGQDVNDRFFSINKSTKPFRMLAQFTAFEPTFMGGLFVTTAEINGQTQILVSPDVGRKAEIRAFVYTGPVKTPPDHNPFAQGLTPQVASYALPQFAAFGLAGVRIAAGRMEANAANDFIVAATGPGVVNRVIVFDPAAPDLEIKKDFSPYGAAFKGGVTVDVGRWKDNTNADDTVADLLTAPGVGNEPRVFVFSGANLTDVNNANDAPLVNALLQFTNNNKRPLGSQAKKALQKKGVTNAAFSKLNDGTMSIVAATSRGLRTEMVRFSPDVDLQYFDIANSKEQKAIADRLFKKYLDGAWLAAKRT